MKKTPLLILASFIITFAFGQQQPSPPQPASPAVQFGIKGGLNLDNIETDLYKNRDARISFHAGLLAHIHINEHLAVQPELMYSAQGFKQEISSNLEMDFITDYINLPVLIQYMNSGFRVETGPQVGFLVNAKQELSDGTEGDTKDYLKKTDFSWLFGLSYISDAGIGISARYVLGITNINEELRDASVVNPEMSHRIWQFGLFYQFGSR